MSAELEKPPQPSQWDVWLADRACPKCKARAPQAMTEGMPEDYWYCWKCRLEFK